MHPMRDLSQTHLRLRECRGIAINPHKDAIWSGAIEETSSEPCISKSAVHVNTTWFTLQPEQDLFD